MATRRTRRYGVKAIQNKALDSSHSPFKRSRKLGPGPRKTTRTAKDEWSCKYVKPYVQVCTAPPKKRGGKNRKKTIRRNPKYVKAYNKAHWEHQVSTRENQGGPKYANEKRAGYKFRPSSAPKRVRRRPRKK